VIVLDKTTRTLEIGLGGAVAAIEPYVTVCYYDVPAQDRVGFGEYQSATTLSRTSGATPVTICAAPAVQGVVRNVRYVCVQNADSGSVTVTIRIDDGGTDYPQYAQALASTKTLVYEHGQGWQVL
jgi:hypothetical protein